MPRQHTAGRWFPSSGPPSTAPWRAALEAALLLALVLAQASIAVVAVGCSCAPPPPPPEDAGPDAGPPPDAGTDASPVGRVIYEPDRTHSPLPADLAAELGAIRESVPDLQDDVFANMGDSISDSPYFLRCFASDVVRLGTHTELEETIDLFLAGDAAGSDPFRRRSLAVGVDWHSGDVLLGVPSPLEEEVTAISPRFAFVMFGSYDVEALTSEAYGQNLMALSETLLGRGVIPILSSIPPRTDDPALDARVPLYNLIMRGVAQGRRVPFVDLHKEMELLAGDGLAADRFHPNVLLETDTPVPCDLTDTGVAFGYNLRNLLSMEALRRADHAARLGEAADREAEVRRMVGDGSPEAPFVIDALPFTDLRDTRESEHRNLDIYTGCSAEDESGPEYLYRIEVTVETAIQAIVIARPGADIDIHLLDETATELGCIARSTRSIREVLPPGTYYLSLDTFVNSGGREQAGEYLLLVRPE